MIDLINIDQDIPFENARRAYTNTSFSPEKRAKSVIESYAQTIQYIADTISKHAVDDKQKAIAQETFDTIREKYKAKTLNMLFKQSRCISVMITGGSNFPVRRAEKANIAERKASDEWLEFHQSLESYAIKLLQKCYTTTEKQDSHLDNYRADLKKAEDLQEQMKLINKLHKAYLKNNNVDLSALPEAQQEVVRTYTPEYNWIPHPIAPYQLSNNLANIKRMQAQLKMLESKQKSRDEQGTVEKAYYKLTTIRNFEEDRYQLKFEDMPTITIRTLLKSNGFKWSPKNQTWQRQLTNNAIGAFRRMAEDAEFKQLIGG